MCSWRSRSIAPSGLLKPDPGVATVPSRRSAVAAVERSPNAWSVWFITRLKKRHSAPNAGTVLLDGRDQLPDRTRRAARTGCLACRHMRRVSRCLLCTRATPQAPRQGRDRCIARAGLARARPIESVGSAGPHNRFQRFASGCVIVGRLRAQAPPRLGSIADAVGPPRADAPRALQEIASRDVVQPPTSIASVQPPRQPYHFHRQSAQLHDRPHSIHVAVLLRKSVQEFTTS